MMKYLSGLADESTITNSPRRKAELLQSTTTAMFSSTSPFIARDFTDDGKRHLLLCASGSVATIKIPNIIQALSKHSNLSIRLILTSSAQNFLNGQSEEQPSLQTIMSYPNVDSIHFDEDEWKHPWKRGQGILHIELRRWADLMVVAPLSANTMAKLVGGLADNLLTSVFRAWDTEGFIDALERKRILLAPAMNTAMWRHPITKRQLIILEDEWGVDKPEGWIEVLRPKEKALACGDVGDGAMKEWPEIVGVIEERMGLSVDLHSD